MGLTADRRPYLIREYVRGVSITAHCERSRSVPSARHQLLASVADVLAQAHDRGITHGGIRPSNIFIVQRNAEPVVKVLDFGVRVASPADDVAALDLLGAELS
jgi:serine/threonine protein kinase